MTATGVVAGTALTSLTMSKFGDKLPLLKDATTGQVNGPAAIAYAVLIPATAGLLLRKYRSISDGLIIGGIASGVLAAIKIYVPAETQATLGFSEYLDRPARVRAIGAPLTPSYSGIKAFGQGGGSVLSSASPFRKSNW